ncbi:MAG: hypothetical protein WAN44_11080 [Propionibacteriaceae bacterium]
MRPASSAVAVKINSAPAGTAPPIHTHDHLAIHQDHHHLLAAAACLTYGVVN